MGAGIGHSGLSALLTFQRKGRLADWRLRVEVRYCVRVARSLTALAAVRFDGRSVIYADHSISGDGVGRI
ncbi:hypothetical protein XMIN_2495 [Xanthomonas citri pv. mangiferaeindicae LMG 941]|nr:hypothetical protein XMIN_2495 [Xanthomonas citri pv. mangiferaeindicae LMG 941]